MADNVIFLIMSHHIAFWKSLECVPLEFDINVGRISFLGANFTMLPFKPDGTITKRDVYPNASDEPIVLAILTHVIYDGYKKYRIPLQMCEFVLDLATGVNLNDEFWRRGLTPLSLPVKMRFFNKRGNFPVGGKKLEDILNIRYAIKKEIPRIYGNTDFFGDSGTLDMGDFRYEDYPHKQNKVSYILTDADKVAIQEFGMSFNPYSVDPHREHIDKFALNELRYGGTEDLMDRQIPCAIRNHPDIFWVTFCEEFDEEFDGNKCPTE